MQFKDGIERYIPHIHCVAYVYAAVVLGWKPGQSSKFRQILATQETLTDFHGDEAKKKKSEKNFKMADSKKLSFSSLPILNIFF